MSNVRVYSDFSLFLMMNKPGKPVISLTFKNNTPEEQPDDTEYKLNQTIDAHTSAIQNIKIATWNVRSTVRKHTDLELNYMIETKKLTSWNNHNAKIFLNLIKAENIKLESSGSRKSCKCSLKSGIRYFQFDHIITSIKLLRLTWSISDHNIVIGEVNYQWIKFKNDVHKTKHLHQTTK